jgi:hypothetical protein
MKMKYLQDEDKIQSSVVLLVAAVLASRVDTLKIKRNAMVALHRYIICRRPDDGNNNWEKSKIARVIRKGREHKIKAMFCLSKPVFLSLVHKLLPWLDDGQSRR